MAFHNISDAVSVQKLDFFMNIYNKRYAFFQKAIIGRHYVLLIYANPRWNYAFDFMVRWEAIGHAMLTANKMWRRNEKSHLIYILQSKTTAL